MRHEQFDISVKRTRQRPSYFVMAPPTNYLPHAKAFNKTFFVIMEQLIALMGAKERDKLHSAMALAKTYLRRFDDTGIVEVVRTNNLLEDYHELIVAKDNEFFLMIDYHTKMAELGVKHVDWWSTFIEGLKTSWATMNDTQRAALWVELDKIYTSYLEYVASYTA